MSDAYYREQSARRTRMLLLLGVIVLGLGCAAFGVYSVFRDTCTNSFDRQPEAVINSFTTAVVQGDADTAAACWHHLAYLDVASGCSEICLSRLWGTPYQINDITLNPNMNPPARTLLVDRYGGPILPGWRRSHRRDHPGRRRPRSTLASLEDRAQRFWRSSVRSVVQIEIYCHNPVFHI